MINRGIECFPHWPWVSFCASAKTFIAKFNKTRRPKTVSLNGKSLTRLGSREDLEKAEVGWYFDPAAIVYVKFGGRGISNTIKIG